MGTARIALVQLPAFSVEDAATSLEHTLRRIDDAAGERPDLIALPEMTYPAYFLGTRDLQELPAPSPEEAMERIAGRAKAHGAWIAAGMALPAAGGGYTNGAALFDRRGELAGRYDKSFLWHFDGKWFERGDAYPVFETDFGRVGMLVCADGRLPEIARSLALGGAQLILDLTAWVSGGRRLNDLTTVQREYMMRVRAAENGVWVAAADKFGIEAESIVYCGHSCFIDPSGDIVAELGPHEEGILAREIELRDAAQPVLRRPDLYGALALPTEGLPVMRTLDEQAALPAWERRIAVVQVTMPGTGDEFLRLARRHVERQRLQDAGLVLFPATPSRHRASYPHDDVLAGMRAIASDTGVMVAFTVSEGAGGSGKRAMHVVGPDGVMATHWQTHRPPGAKYEPMPLGHEPAAVVGTPVGRLGLMVAAEGFVPEVARSLMLRGAEILLWAADNPPWPMLPFARSRADENRVFVACAAAPTQTGLTAVVDPSGRMAAVALEGAEVAVSATVNGMLAHLKEMAPGTDVVRGRQPASYRRLVSSGRRVEAVL